MRVLVIEDESKMLALLRDGLEREGHHVMIATDGGEGLDIGANFEFEAIILDRMLPVLDGIEVATRLRRSNCQTPILMLTARDALQDVVSGLDSGVDDYLTKPFAFAELLARLRALRRRLPTYAPEVLRFEDLELDVEGQQVRRGNEHIKLTRTEFRLLEYMMRQPAKVHHREALINAIWGYDCAVESNTVDAFIKQLRVKVDGTGSVRLIQTVRGVGYRLSREQV